MIWINSVSIFLGQANFAMSNPDEMASTALPLYVQISEFLIREIAAGRLPDESRLPPERILAKTLGTTVRTLRKALAILEEKGLLHRVHGSGNYIRAKGQISSVYAMFRIELLQGGGLPSARILAAETRAKPAHLPAFGSAQTALRIRRLRYLNQTPVAVEEIWLDSSVGALSRAQMSDSLYRSYRLHLDLRITRAEDYVSVGQVPHWAPLEAGLAIGGIVPVVRRFSHDQTRGCVEFSQSWINPQTAHYVQRLG